ncbi:MAG: GNAT family N-acetyltransferase [Planctomycetota bacterium]|jgi:predicted N-acetyltransferase YhbS
MKNNQVAALHAGLARERQYWQLTREKAMKIRVATESDRSEILNIHKHAFGNEKGPVISKLVDDLLDDETARPILSLVAVDDNRLIGHILYTKALITQSEASVSAQILAPLAVLPDVQKCGTGQKLIEEGLKRLKISGTELVFVLGLSALRIRPGGKTRY